MAAAMVANTAGRSRESGIRRVSVRTLWPVLPVLLALGGAVSHAADKEPQCGGVAGNPELAIKVCTRLIEFGSLDRPQLARAYYIRGTEWVNQGNYDRGIADFTLALDLDPKLVAAYFNRALARSEKGDGDLAIADYDAVLKLSPTDTKAHIGRAFEWTVKGDYKRAADDYEAIVKLEPQSATGYFGRGRARFYAGDFTSAASDLARAYELEPSTYTALWTYLARRRANVAAEKSLAQESTRTPTLTWPAPIVALYLGSSNPENVQKAATDVNLNRQRDRRCEANFYIAHWHLLRGERDPAVQLLRNARSSCPSSFIEHEGAVAELRRLGQLP
jgi:lipoprotein NlpI